MKSKFSILVVIALSISISAKNDITILQSNSSTLLVEYKTIITDTSLISVNNTAFLDISIFNGIIDYSTEFKPKLPYRLVNIGVPSEFGNTIEIVSSEFSYLNNSPVPVLKKSTSESQIGLNESVYNVSRDEPVVFDEFGISRNLGIQTIRISPVSYDPVNKRTKVYSKIVFRIRYSSQRINHKKIDENYAEHSILNFNVASTWGIDQKSLKKASVNSVLASGTWYRFVAPEEGIYRINRTDLAAIGITASTVDPRTIKIYNNGGKNLSVLPESDDPVDLTETAIFIQGEEDGKFDEGDYILFYGRGIDSWDYNTSRSKILRSHNYFSTNNYFWITSGGNNGKRVAAVNSLNDPSAITQTLTSAVAFFEEDLINLGHSGKIYWGAELNSTTKTLTYVNSLNGVEPGTQINYNFRMCNASPPNFTLRITENDNQILSRTMFGYGTTDYRWGQLAEFTAAYTGNLPDERSVLKFAYSSSSNEAKGFLDYFEIQYRKKLRAYEDQLIFFTDTSSVPINLRLYDFSNSSNIVFDITDYANITKVNPVSQSGGELTIQVAGSSKLQNKFIAVNASKYKSISGIESVKNSNIHGISPGAEYVIITNPKFAEAANRMKTYRESDSPNKLRSAIVYTDEIMNEFANGGNDPGGIRNFLRFAYLNWEVKPFYAFILGDGTYDYLDLEGTGTNFVPTNQTYESLDEINSYPFDDFYSRIIGNDQKADIAVGRVNTVTVADATNYVDKVIYYEKSNNKGIWRNTITLVADDGLTTEGDDTSTHTRQAEQLSSEIPDYFNKSKIFLSKYPTVITGIGRRKPAVNQAIIDAVNNGTLLLNYTGHGNPDVWAHENVFERSSTLPQFNNDKYFFLTAATCDFGKYDDPNSVSGTEEMILLEKRGAIGVFSASRAVYSIENAQINQLLYSFLMDEKLNPTLGNAFYLVKQQETSVNDEKYHLFCDPAIRLNKPSLPVKIDRVNNSPSTSTIQIKALSETNIKGSVRDANGSINTAYNGEGIISVFDSERRLHLDDINYDINEQGGIIFRGRVSVENGLFETNFRVPKDISYENKNGKIVSYIFDENTDGIGFTDNIIVGGTDSDVNNDGKGPEVEIFFDDLNNAGASLVNPDFNLFVKLTDETGLNTTGTGVGHKLEGIIDDDEEKAIDFSNYFIGDLNAGGTSGIIDYKFTEVPAGEHKIRIKAWDVFNNPTSVETYFSVVEGEGIAVHDVLNYPNPFSGNTTFTFQHNLNSYIDVKIKVYTIAGRNIKEIESTGISDRFVRIPWDGKDQDGAELASGTYLYKLIIKSTDGEFQKSILGKLAVFH